MPKPVPALRATPPSTRPALRRAAAVRAALVLVAALGLAAAAAAQEPAADAADAGDPAAGPLPAEPAVDETVIVPLVLGEDDGPDEFAYQTYDAIENTLDFHFAVLPPLVLPGPGSRELRDVQRDPKTVPIAPITARAPDAVDTVRSVHVSLSESPTTLMSLDNRQSLQWRIAGLPDAAEAPANIVAPVRPTAVDPQGFSLGATWGAEDRIRAPLLDAIAWQAQADVGSGAAPDRGTTVVRRSLRLTAGWDRADQVAFNLSQGVQVGGGTAYQHYATGVRASLFDPPQAMRLSGFVELSGEHIALNNLADNYGATVNAGATWRATPSTQIDFSLTRGLAPTAETQSNVGLNVKF
jgi:hypothetical protein